MHKERYHRESNRHPIRRGADDRWNIIRIRIFVLVRISIGRGAAHILVNSEPCGLGDDGRRRDDASWTIVEWPQEIVEFPEENLEFWAITMLEI